MPELTARDTEGREVRVASRGNGATLLFIFSPTCDRLAARRGDRVVGGKLSAWTDRRGAGED
ncbi:MAG: hypothetical protein ACREEM_04445 [Blastocatellia bacterium]